MANRNGWSLAKATKIEQGLQNLLRNVDKIIDVNGSSWGSEKYGVNFLFQGVQGNFLCQYDPNNQELVILTAGKRPETVSDVAEHICSEFPEAKYNKGRMLKHCWTGINEDQIAGYNGKRTVIVSIGY